MQVSETNMLESRWDQAVNDSLRGYIPLTFVSRYTFSPYGGSFALPTVYMVFIWQCLRSSSKDVCAIMLGRRAYAQLLPYRPYPDGLMLYLIDCPI